MSQARWQRGHRSSAMGTHTEDEPAPPDPPASPAPPAHAPRASAPSIHTLAFNPVIVAIPFSALTEDSGRHGQRLWATSRSSFPPDFLRRTVTGGQPCGVFGICRRLSAGASPSEPRGRLEGAQHPLHGGVPRRPAPGACPDDAAPHPGAPIHQDPVRGDLGGGLQAMPRGVQGRTWRRSPIPDRPFGTPE